MIVVYVHAVNTIVVVDDVFGGVGSGGGGDVKDNHSRTRHNAP